MTGCVSKKPRPKPYDSLYVTKSLYEFQSRNDLKSKIEQLRPIMSEEVHFQISLENTERTVTNYLRFNSTRSKVFVESSTPTDTRFRFIDVPGISPDRLFQLSITESEDGKITKLEEFELIPFQTNK